MKLKLKRAKDHFETLAESVTDFLRDPEAQSAVLQADEQRRPVIVMQGVKEPRPEWDVLVGDCVHNLRSALDHLAFQLMVATTSPRRQREFVKSSEFPIFMSGRKFRRLQRNGLPTNDSGLHKIRGVSDSARTLIEGLQPYHRRKYPDTRRLWELRELSNTDKHRLFPLVHTAFELERVQFIGDAPFELREFDSIPGPLKRGAVVARFAYATIPQPVSMHVNAYLMTDITFNNGQRTPYPVRGEPVLFTLHGIMRFIAQEVVCHRA